MASSSGPAKPDSAGTEACATAWGPLAKRNTEARPVAGDERERAKGIGLLRSGACVTSPSLMPDPTPSPATVGHEILDSEILWLLMETIPDRIYFKDLQSRFVRVNRAHAEWLGVAGPQAVVGRIDLDFFAEAHARRALADEAEIIRTGKPLVGQAELIVKADGTTRWGSSTKMPWRDANGQIIGTFGLTRDHTETKLIEEKLEQERTLLRTIIDHLPSRVFVKDKLGRYLLNNCAHQKMIGVGSQAEAVGHSIMDFQADARGERSSAEDHRVLTGGRPIFDQEDRDELPDGSHRWSLTTKVPLHDLRGELIGVVGISHDITDRKQVEEELRVRTVKMETDLRMACRIQDVFLTQPHPVFPRGVPQEASALRFASRYVPATSLGGDFFEVIQLSDTQCMVLICDVMGHGVRAGLLTALIRGLVSKLDERAENPAQVLAEINRGFLPIVRRTGQPVFASVFCGVIDTESGRLAYANAGHPPPLHLRRSTGTAIALRHTSPEPATGLMEGFAFTRHECEFGVGDGLLCYTDGVLEAAAATGELFGEERLLALTLAHSALAGIGLIERVVEAVASFCGRGGFDDDIGLLIAESTGRTCPVSALNWEI